MSTRSKAAAANLFFFSWLFQDSADSVPIYRLIDILDRYMNIAPFLKIILLLNPTSTSQIKLNICLAVIT